MIADIFFPFSFEGIDYAHFSRHFFNAKCINIATGIDRRTECSLCPLIT
jgi:hypothetical protein